jgi:TRAP-type C4-dicarboxylate transport system substrate-binding protein
VHELTKFHSEFDNTGGALYTTTFVMTMNKAKYDALSPENKRVIDANSGMATSAWLGKTQQGNDPAGRKTAVDRGNQIYQFTAAQREEFIKLSARIDDEWVADMDKRGFKGAELLSTAKALIARHGRG